MYTMRGDRHYEYQFAGERLRRAVGGEVLLDVGPGTRAAMARHAISLGWSVNGIDLMPCDYVNDAFTFIKGDLRTVPLNPYYDAVLCISSIEHFGLPGRYNVTKYEVDADLEGMARIREVCLSRTDVIVTIPVGVDSVLSPFHRVYGEKRIPLLFGGFRIEEEKYYAKQGGVDDYVQVDWAVAMLTRPTLEPAHYTALGCFLLRRSG